MIVREIYCKTALSKSLLPGLDYALNPYRGCEHSCIYCYAPAVLREKRTWGSFVDVKVNIPTVLAKELKTKCDGKRRRRFPSNVWNCLRQFQSKKGVVGIGTVTDAYQPIETRYELTRKCLEVLLRYDFPISIQTKSALVLRDIELIKKYSIKDVGITITTIDDEMRKKYEPRSSSIEERLNALKKLAENKIETWVFIGPIMLGITDKNNNLEKLIEKIASVHVKNIMVDRLRLKRGVWNNIKRFLTSYKPELIPKYEKILFHTTDYFEKTQSKIETLCKKYFMKCELAF